MKMKKSKNQAAGPSSTMGIMRFKDEQNQFHISPEVVVIVSIAIAVIILFLKAFFNL